MAKLATDMVLNVYGTIAYTDRSWAPVEFTVAYNQNLSNPYTNLNDYSELNQAAPKGKGLSQTSSTPLNLFYATVSPGSIALTPSAPAVSKTVSDFTFMMTGTVSYNDRTWDTFAVEYVNGVTNLTPNSTGTDWEAMNVLNHASLVSAFEKLAGVGHVTIS
jgi:hypothetical protein